MLRPNDFARTPFEPSGIVQVLLIEPAALGSRPTAFVRFNHDHPAGYARDSLGRYLSDELIPVPAPPPPFTPLTF